MDIVSADISGAFQTRFDGQHINNSMQDFCELSVFVSIQDEKFLKFAEQCICQHVCLLL
jgi:hypothetical protein